MPPEQDALKTTYCTPEDIAQTMDLPDPNDKFGYLKFSDVTHPSREQVCRMIRANEDMIDRRVRRTWRENRVKDQVLTIQTYWHDANGWRSDYYQQGGYYVQLRKNVRPWDPSKGDKLEIRNNFNKWVDFTDNVTGDVDDPKMSRYACWFDYEYGKLYIHTRLFQVKGNALRISYRYGSDESELPDAIRRLCSLMTSIQIITMQFYNVKIGMGADIQGVKDSIINMWQQECDNIMSSFQRSGSVHSMLR